MVPTAQAESLCNSMPGSCIGYITPGTNAGTWANVPANSSQLISKPLNDIISTANPITNYLYFKNAPTYTAGTPAQIWDPSAAGAYTCVGTLQNGACVLDIDDAQTYCDTDASCIGYIVPGSGNTAAITWLPSNPSAVQLVSVSPTTNTSYSNGTATNNMNTFYAKNMS